jgi:hypothetical protein
MSRRVVLGGEDGGDDTGGGLSELGGADRRPLTLHEVSGGAGVGWRRWVASAALLLFASLWPRFFFFPFLFVSLVCCACGWPVVQRFSKLPPPPPRHEVKTAFHVRVQEKERAQSRCGVSFFVFVFVFSSDEGFMFLMFDLVSF